MQDLRKFTVEPPFVGAIHESPLLYMLFMRKSCNAFNGRTIKWSYEVDGQRMILF